jgi:hypothetical protein
MDNHDDLAEQLEKCEFYDLPGTLHVKIFQALLDHIIEQDSFRSYLVDLPERKSGISVYS